MLYVTALTILLQLGAAVRLPIFAGLPLLAVRAALLEWSRAAELSCDRVAAVVTRDPMAVCRTLMTLSGGAATDELSLDAFLKQGLDYDEQGGGLERVSRLLMHLNITHPMPVRRVHELLTWVRGGDYDRLVGGEYVRRGDEPRARAEADSAGAFYAERVRDALREAGGSVSDVSQQLGEWLARQRR